MLTSIENQTEIIKEQEKLDVEKLKIKKEKVDLLKQQVKELKIKNKISSERNKILSTMNKNLELLCSTVKGSTDTAFIHHNDFIKVLETSCIRNIAYVKEVEFVSEEIKDKNEELDK